MEPEKKNGMNFKIGIRELIIIIGFAIVLTTTLQTRASNADVSALEKRVQTIESKIQMICESQTEMKNTLKEINSDVKILLDKTSKLEAKSK
jgi:polyhydroxyalkanoate synthesis regulator phasin